MVSTAAAAPFAGGKRWPGALGAFVAARAARAPPAGGTLPASAGERRQVQELGVWVPFFGFKQRQCRVLYYRDLAGGEVG